MRGATRRRRTSDERCDFYYSSRVVVSRPGGWSEPKLHSDHRQQRPFRRARSRRFSNLAVASVSPRVGGPLVRAGMWRRAREAASRRAARLAAALGAPRRRAERGAREAADPRSESDPSGCAPRWRWRRAATRGRGAPARGAPGAAPEDAPGSLPRTPPRPRRAVEDGSEDANATRGTPTTMPLGVVDDAAPIAALPATPATAAAARAFDAPYPSLPSPLVERPSRDAEGDGEDDARGHRDAAAASSGPATATPRVDADASGVPTTVARVAAVEPDDDDRPLASRDRWLERLDALSRDVLLRRSLLDADEWWTRGGTTRRRSTTLAAAEAATRERRNESPPDDAPVERTAALRTAALRTASEGAGSSSSPEPARAVRGVSVGTNTEEDDDARASSADADATKKKKKAPSPSSSSARGVSSRTRMRRREPGPRSDSGDHLRGGSERASWSGYAERAAESVGSRASGGSRASAESFAAESFSFGGAEGEGGRGGRLRGRDGRPRDGTRGLARERNGPAAGGIPFRRASPPRAALAPRRARAAPSAPRRGARRAGDKAAAAAAGANLRRSSEAAAAAAGANLGSRSSEGGTTRKTTNLRWRGTLSRDPLASPSRRSSTRSRRSRRRTRRRPWG